MDFDQFIDLVEKTKQLHPIWFGLDSDKIPTEGDVRMAEKRLGAQFPKDYRDFLLKFGGGYFGLSKVFSVQPDSDWNVIDINLGAKALQEGYIAISDNETGDYFGYKIIEGICEPWIYFYDHEEDKWKKTEFCNIFEYLKKYGLTN
ncbi:hypothetical protein MTYM_02264 [Methylococcales bacterium]|nr:hypothetical protein MTYM_02264 [Methylococcales bacterium]